MEKNISKLKDIWKNLKKSPSRTYLEKTVRSKLEQIENIKQDFELAELEEKDNNDIVALRLEFNSLYRLLIEYLNNSIKFSSDNKDNIMAAFSLETVSKALPLFAGNNEELESFLITAELIEKTLSETAKQDFIQYVYHAKLTSKVRTAIGSCVKPENFTALKALLQQRYRITRTIPELQAKLSTTYQGKLPVYIYKEKITAIIDNLNKLGIEELGQQATDPEKNVIMRLNNKLALDIFKKGIDDRYKTTLYASRPSTLQEAFDLAIELENEHKSTSNSILHVNRQQPQYQRQSYNRTFNNNRNNVTNFRPNNYNGTNNYNHFRPNNNNNNNYNGNNFRPNNYNNNNYNNYNRNNRVTNNSNRNFGQNNRNNTNRNFSNNNNNRRNIRTINNEGNEIGSGYMNIPDSQN